MIEIQLFNHKKLIRDYVEVSLTKYLGFNVSDMFDVADNCYIFGGSIRDIISNRVSEINDIDILTVSKSCMALGDLLHKNGYILNNDSERHENIGELYNLKDVIFEPHTYIKGDKTVQLIRPYGNVVVSKHILNTLLTNVDLTTSGLYYDGMYVNESVFGAFSDVVNNKFRILDDSIMLNPNRIDSRTNKLLKKGWVHEKNPHTLYPIYPREIYDEDYYENKDYLTFINRQLNLEKILREYNF